MWRVWGEVEKGSRLAVVRFESETEWCHTPFTGSGTIISDLNTRVSVGAYVNVGVSLSISISLDQYLASLTRSVSQNNWWIAISGSCLPSPFSPHTHGMVWYEEGITRRSNPIPPLLPSFRPCLVPRQTNRRGQRVPITASAMSL